jgi:hypothetical protein
VVAAAVRLLNGFLHPQSPAQWQLLLVGALIHLVHSVLLLLVQMLLRGVINPGALGVLALEAHLIL